MQSVVTERFMVRQVRFQVIMVLIVAAIFLPGCATIIHGPTEQITFTSEPTGAHLTVAGHRTTTPAVLILKRRGKHVASFNMPGYERQEVQIKEGISLWFLLGNLGFGGIPGYVIDAITGSIGNLSPDNVHANLAPVQQAAAFDPPRYAHRRYAQIEEKCESGELDGPDEKR